MLFNLLQNKSPEFVRHMVAQELKRFGFGDKDTYEDSSGTKFGALVRAKEGKSPYDDGVQAIFVQLIRRANGYEFRCSHRLCLAGLEGFGDLQTASGAPLPPRAFTEGITRFMLVRSDDLMDQVLQLICALYPVKYELPDPKLFLSQFIEEEVEEVVPAINDLRVSGRIKTLIPLSPGYRFDLELALTHAILEVQFTPMGDGPYPELGLGDAVYVSGELDHRHIVAFDVQKLS